MFEVKVAYVLLAVIVGADGQVGHLSTVSQVFGDKSLCETAGFALQTIAMDAADKANLKLKTSYICVTQSVTGENK